MPEIKDPWNPTWSEIRQWAYDVDAEAPCQDWDLSLLWRGYEDLYLELAVSVDCPKKRFFLSILYLMVGDQVRSGTDHQAMFNLKAFIAKADAFDDKAIQAWQSRSIDLLNHPEKFDYEQWCAGGLASDP